MSISSSVWQVVWRHVAVGKLGIAVSVVNIWVRLVRVLVLVLELAAALILGAWVMGALVWSVGVLRVLVLRHAMVSLRSVAIIVAGIHGVHGLLRLVVVRMTRIVGRRGMPPSRRRISLTSCHLNGRSSTSLFVLPSRQMALTHRAGLGIEG